MTTNLQKQIKDIIPTYVIRVADVLISNGFEAYLVGGSVRDIVLSKSPKDFDIATNALPEQIQKLFKKSVATGAKFGTIIVLMEDENNERFDVEVTTYRSESDYFGGRWPAKVEFTSKISDDLSRRDFTINAIAISLDDVTIKIKDSILDPFGGLVDIDKKLIKAVGEPLERFTEDGLRPVRACRIASVLGFDIEEKTFEAAKKTLDVVKMVSIERIRDEFNKIIYNSSKPSVGFNLLDQIGVLKVYLPELIEAKDFDQPEYHSDNVFEHSLAALDIAEDSVKWAALLHDIGKIRTKHVDEKGIHYYGHDVEGAKMASEILTRLKFPSKEVDRISNLIRWHMFYYPSHEWRRENTEFSTALENDKDKSRHGWSDGAIRRFINNVGGVDAVEELIKLRIADATSNKKSDFSADELVAMQKRIAEVISEDMAIKISDLAINGADLMRLGYEPGPVFNKILKYLLEIVIDEPMKNNKEELTKIIKANF